ncbi:hypothetical protein [Hydrogenophaga sp. 5NK40-0174]
MCLNSADTASGTREIQLNSDVSVRQAQLNAYLRVLAQVRR